MARRRFFVEAVQHGQAELVGEQAHHLRNVLRVEAGQRYEISDSEQVYLSEVQLATKKRVVFDIIEELPLVLPPVRLHLYLSLVKFDRFELAIEKTTELGVERIVPVVANRTGKGLEKAAGKRARRWEKIAREASQQSRRVRLPEIAGVMRFPEALASDGNRKYFLEEVAGGAGPILNALTRARGPDNLVAVLVGPEGGWIDPEREAAREAGWRFASLGPQILRAVPAATAAAAVLMAAWGASGA